MEGRKKKERTKEIKKGGTKVRKRQKERNMHRTKERKKERGRMEGRKKERKKGRASKNNPPSFGDSGSLKHAPSYHHITYTGPVIRRFRFITPPLCLRQPRRLKGRGFVLSCKRHVRERVFKIYDEPDSLNEGGFELKIADEPESPNQVACLRHIMTGFKIYDEPDSPN